MAGGTDMVSQRITLTKEVARQRIKKQIVR